MAIKKVEIESANCVIETNLYDFEINGEDIREILKRSFEGGLEKNKKYQAYLKIEIAAIEEEPLQITNNWNKEKDNILFGEDASERKPYANSI